jgi:hypothetical protein
MLYVNMLKRHYLVWVLDTYLCPHIPGAFEVVLAEEVLGDDGALEGREAVCWVVL